MLTCTCFSTDARSMHVPSVFFGYKRSRVFLWLHPKWCLVCDALCLLPHNFPAIKRIHTCVRACVRVYDFHRMRITNTKQACTLINMRIVFIHFTTHHSCSRSASPAFLSHKRTQIPTLWQLRRGYVSFVAVLFWFDKVTIHKSICCVRTIKDFWTQPTRFYVPNRRKN